MPVVRRFRGSRLGNPEPATAGSVGEMEGEARHAVRPGVILGVLLVAACAYALLQSLVVPALPVLQKELHATTSGVAWVFTAFLLSAVDRHADRGPARATCSASGACS